MAKSSVVITKGLLLLSLLLLLLVRKPPKKKISAALRSGKMVYRPYQNWVLTHQVEGALPEQKRRTSVHLKSLLKYIVLISSSSSPPERRNVIIDFSRWWYPKNLAHKWFVTSKMLRYGECHLVQNTHHNYLYKCIMAKTMNIHHQINDYVWRAI